MFLLLLECKCRNILLGGLLDDEKLKWECSRKLFLREIFMVMGFKWLRIMSSSGLLWGGS
jgi:hypothetical protein